MRNKQKIIAAIGMLTSLNVIGLYLAANIHSFLSTGSLYRSLHPIKIFKFVITSNAVKFFGLFFLFSAMFLLHIFWMQRIYNVSSSMIEVTPAIKTPAVAGNGEYGTAKWMRERDFSHHFTVVDIPSISQIKRIQERSEDDG